MRVYECRGKEVVRECVRMHVGVHVCSACVLVRVRVCVCACVYVCVCSCERVCVVCAGTLVYTHMWVFV